MKHVRHIDIPSLDVYVCEWMDGFKAAAPAIPGCVFRHRNETFATWMIAITVEAMGAEKRTEVSHGN